MPWSPRNSGRVDSSFSSFLIFVARNKTGYTLIYLMHEFWSGGTLLKCAMVFLCCLSQVARAHPAVFSAAAISVLAPYTNHHLKHHRAVDAKNAGSSSESTSKHRRLVLSQPRQLTDSSPQSSQPPSPLHNAAEDPQVNTSKYSSKPMHPRSFTGKINSKMYVLVLSVFRTSHSFLFPQSS